ncbi:fibronectin type III domain-containing protein, partial [Candidatus Woesebacteria bacterium]|nr:fibronectin type III domain-containing protein [Candidatus Woesebacteria bacterium]
TWAPLTYKFDNTAPTNPVSITVSPAGYAPTNEFTFSWPDGVDTASNIAGYQYKTGTDSGTLSEWSATSSALLVTIPDAAYKTDDNIFYLRTIDNAGNVSSTNLQATYYFAGQGASVPLNLRATQSSSDEDAYSFTWDPPTTHLGDESEINYCYTIVEKPDAVGCKFTGEGVTSLPEAKRGVKPGLNSFYLVAKNPESTGGSINYGAYAEIVFEVNAAVPGIPVNVAVSDISDKAAEEWTLVTRWSAPVTNSESVSSYSVYRSTDDVTYSLIGSSIPGTSHINSDLEQITYYYKVKACNYVGDCGDFSNTVSLLPDGKYTEPPGLSAGPTSSAITTKQATISWSTDRASDSKVQYGTTPGSYLTSEPSSSVQTTDHTINLSNLSPGTTYYYKAKWTDEDGNTGVSAEKNFTTQPAPSVKDVSVPTLGLDSAIVKFTSTGASSVKIFYGTTTAFGGVKEIATSTSETTYTATIDELLDGTKYYYKINAFDAEDNEYAGTILDFTTMPRPKISTVRIQQVKNTAKSTVLVTWLTNTATSSIVTYYPTDSPAQAQDEVNVNLANGAHRILIRGLLANTPYTLVVKGRDKAGNEAVSELQRFTTAIDTRPAQISDLRVESTIQPGESSSDLATAQLIVSWTTDEPATSQVEFGEGTGVTYTQQSQEDSSLTINHYVVISGLTPSKVYHLRAISKDVVGNDTRSADTVMITARATDDALGLVISNLGQVFSFLR